MTQATPPASERYNPWLQGLSAFGFLAVIFGIALIWNATPDIHHVIDPPIVIGAISPWVFVGAALFAAGFMAWIGCAVVMAVRWTSATTTTEGVASSSWTPQFMGWYPNPNGRGERYFDGTTWTNRIR